MAFFRRQRSAIVLLLSLLGVISHCSASLFSSRRDAASTVTATAVVSSRGGARGAARSSSKSSIVSTVDSAAPIKKNSSLFFAPSSSSYQISDLAAGSNSGTTTTTSSSRKKVACGLYIWNAPSALLHRWCTHLLKESIYEGRGGVKFVRIEPGSILQLLYPSSRYSPDSCLFCGGNYQDHLALAWAKHLYTPLDRRLDDDYQKGRLEQEQKEINIIMPTKNIPKRRVSKTTRTRSSSSSFSSSSTRQRRETRGRNSTRRRKQHHHHQSLPESPPLEPRILYAFHRQYVLDATDLVDALRQRQGQQQRRHRRLGLLEKLWPSGDRKQQKLLQQLQQQQQLQSKNGGGGNSQILELRKNSNYYNLSLQPTRTLSSPHPLPPSTTTIPSNQASLPSPAPTPKKNLYYLVPVPTTITTPTSSNSSKGGVDPPPLRNKRNPSRIALYLVRSILLGGLDNLIELEALDNAKEKERQRIGKGILLHRE